VCLPLLIFPCTIKSRSSLLAPAHPGRPGKRAVKRLWCGVVVYNFKQFYHTPESFTTVDITTGFSVFLTWLFYLSISPRGLLRSNLAPYRGCGYFAECGKLSRGNLRKIKCGTFRKLPLVAFPHSAAEKLCISMDRKTTVRSHCTTDVQPMHAIPWSLKKWKKWKMVYWI